MGTANTSHFICSLEYSCSLLFIFCNVLLIAFLKSHSDWELKASMSRARSNFQRDGTCKKSDNIHNDVT